MDIQEALELTLQDLKTSANPEIVGEFINVVRIMRQEVLTPRMAVGDVKKKIWDILRKNRTLLSEVLNCTATLQMMLGKDDCMANITRLAGALKIFGDSPLTADIDDIDKTFPTQQELFDLFENNRWLFLITLFAINLRLLVVFVPQSSMVEV